ncbi:MAG: sulfotransferase family protein [Alphaproteobacteria bacterium]|nr:sulfotransferase family protein [Alphaproteobacteria bacterium]
MARLLISPSARAVGRLFGPSLDEAQYLVNWSRRHRFVYVEVPKAACSTIKLTLQRIELDDRDYTPANKHARSRSPLLAPLSAPREFLEALHAKDVLRFCFVRDPYSRILAAYIEKLAGDDFERDMRLAELGFSQTPGFEEFLTVLARRGPGFDIHWARQVDLLRPDVIPYDFVGRFENFRTDFETVLARIGRDAGWIADAREHRTGASGRVKEIGTQARALIAEIYAEDFKRYGYSI